jgi:hypothetical protein
VKLETGNQSGVPIAADRRMIAGRVGVEESYQTDLVIKGVELPGDFDCQGSCSTPACQQYRTLRADSEDLFHIGRRPIYHGLRLGSTKQFAHTIYRPLTWQHDINVVPILDPPPPPASSALARDATVIAGSLCFYPKSNFSPPAFSVYVIKTVSFGLQVGLVVRAGPSPSQTPMNVAETDYVLDF